MTSEFHQTDKIRSRHMGDPCLRTSASSMLRIPANSAKFANHTNPKRKRGGVGLHLCVSRPRVPTDPRPSVNPPCNQDATPPRLRFGLVLRIPRLNKLCLILAVLVCAIVPARIAWAVGSQQTLRGEDLQVDVDSRWCGCRFGGCYPVRLQIRNTGKARELTVQYSRLAMRSSESSLVQQKISLEENSTRKLTLSIPLCDDSSGGPLQVLVDGKVIPQLKMNLSLSPEGDPNEHPPEMLVIAKSRVELAPWGVVAEQLGESPVLRTYSSPRTTVSDLHSEVVEPSSLPENWIDYSGLDLIAVALPVWQAADFTEPAREAILKWVEMGGTLIVYGVGSRAQDSQDLTNRLQLANRGFVSNKWIDGDTNLRYEQPIRWSEVRTHLRMGTTVGSRTSEPLNERSWLLEASHPPFERRNLMLGRVYAMSGDPFPGTLDDWGWLLNDLNKENWSWTARNGINHRRRSARFSEFTIPHVGEVPAKMFLALISVFTLVIGPVNYYILNRRRQLYLLLVTIPLFATLTSVSLFGYAVIADGLDVKARVRSVTLLDQRNHDAVSISRAGYYAGMSPWKGLNFTANTLVMPIWSDREDPIPGDVNWTEGQHLGSSWLRSRTPTQFTFSTAHVERGRLEIVGLTSNGQELQVANGFAWDIAEILVRDKSNRFFYGRDLRAGAAATLRQAGSEELLKFVVKISAPLTLEKTTSAATGPVVEPHPGHRGSIAWRRGGEVEDVAPDDYGKSKQERLLKALRLGVESMGTANELPQQSYIAVCNQPPGIDTGLKSMTEVQSLHVLYGRY